MDIKSEVIEIIDELFMEDVSDMMDEDLFDAGVLDSMGTVELIVEIENRFDIRVPVTEFGRDDWNTAKKRRRRIGWRRRPNRFAVGCRTESQRHQSHHH